MRVLHFSDIHVDTPLRPSLRHVTNKRLIGMVNHWLRRRARFNGARAKLTALGRFAERSGVDLVIFSGDYTVLGTDVEFAAARAAIEPLMRAPAGFVNVPGNHDVYLQDNVRDRWFERRFEDTLASDLPETATDGPWPLVRLLGAHVAVVAVSSARPNPAPWRSSGRIPETQLAALGRLLGGPELAGRFVFIVTHHAPRDRHGRPDRPHHGLINADAFLAACGGTERGAILCGHIHHTYTMRLPGVGPVLFNAGSATYAGREGCWLFEVRPGETGALPCRLGADGWHADRESAFAW